MEYDSVEPYQKRLRHPSIYAIVFAMKRVVRKYIIPHKSNGFRPHIVRAAGIFVLLVLIAGAFLGSQAQRLALTSGNFLASVLPSVLVDLANNDRTDNQIASLSVNPLLEEAARMKAEDMASKGYFAHTSPEGVTPWYWFSQAQYHFAYAGENLATNFDDSAAVNAAWMNSPGHRENILNEHFTEVGIATARGEFEGKETIFVVQLFGRPVRAESTVQSPPVAVVETQPQMAPAVEEPAVVPVLAEETDTGSFVAVQNAQVLASDAPGLFATSPRYSSLLQRFITSPTKTLAVVYLLISIILLAILIAVLVVDHNRRVRHLAVVLILFAVLVGTFYAFRLFIVENVVVPGASHSVAPQVQATSQIR